MLRKQTFWGGVHPAGRKELSSGAPLEDCPPPREVVIPLLQHIGKPCTPLVKAGDHVDMGQKIGDGEGLCVPVHASVSGTVKAVEPRSHPSGQPHLAVVIENDFQNTYHSAVPPCADTDALDADALIRRIREAGLVGMGGATFPTDIKANIGKVETLIANACECEPYITADDALLCTDADRAIRGLRLLRQPPDNATTPAGAAVIVCAGRSCFYFGNSLLPARTNLPPAALPQRWTGLLPVHFLFCERETEERMR